MGFRKRLFSIKTKYQQAFKRQHPHGLCISHITSIQYIILLQQALVSHWRFPLLCWHWLSKINARKSHNRGGGLAQIFVHVVGETNLPLANQSSIIFDNSTSSRLDSNFVNDEQYWKFQLFSNETLLLSTNKERIRCRHLGPPDLLPQAASP